MSIIDKLSKVQDSTSGITPTGVFKGEEEKKKLDSYFGDNDEDKRKAKRVSDEANLKLEYENKSEVLKRIADSLQKKADSLQKKADSLELENAEIKTSFDKYIRDNKKTIKTLQKRHASLSSNYKKVVDELETEKEIKEKTITAFDNFEEFFEKDKLEQTKSVQTLLSKIEELKIATEDANELVFNYDPIEGIFSDAESTTKATFEEVTDTIISLSSLFPDKKLTINIGGERKEPATLQSLATLKKQKDSMADEEPETTRDQEFTQVLEHYLQGKADFEDITTIDRTKLNPSFQELIKAMEVTGGSLSEEQYREMKDKVTKALEETQSSIPSFALIADSKDDLVTVLNAQGFTQEEFINIEQRIPGTPERFRISDSIPPNSTTVELPNGKYLVCD